MKSLTDKCERCGEGRLRSWHELTEEERQATLRLPASADYSADERRTRHRWCTRCWHEDTQGRERNV